MRNDEENRPRKRGCLKWTCGGCLAAVLLLCGVAAFSWRYLTRRETGISAWENLPPSTAVAVEARDAYSILEYLLRDKGVMSLATRFAGLIQERAAYGGAPGSDIGELLNVHERLQFLLSAFMPGSAILGINHAGNFYLIARPPNWYRLIMAQDGDIELKSIEGRTVFLSHIDGWVVAATLRDVVAEILDHWNDRAAPLGPARSERGAFVVMAGRTSKGAGEAAAAPAQPQLLGLGDPFAANKPSPAADGAAWTASLAPHDGGWKMEGRAARIAAADMKAFFNDVAAKTGLSDIPALPPLGTSDAIARAVVSPRLLDRLLPPAPPGNSRNDPASNARAFLRKEWLENATGDYLLRAKKPAAAPDSDLPPLPVFTFGWRLAEGGDRANAADSFAASLRGLVDSLMDGNPKLARGLWQNITIRELDRIDGKGETWEVPPVLVNSARPSWFFPTGGATAGGWLATDPAGLPESPDFGGDAAAPIAAGSFAGSVQWDFSEDFLLSLLNLCRDRLETLPDSAVPDREKLKAGMAFLCDILAAFPKGTLNCRGNAEEARVSFTATIPFGVEAGSLSPP